MDYIFTITGFSKYLFLIFGILILMYNNAFYRKNEGEIPKFEKVFSFSLVLKMKMKYYIENSVVYFKLYMNCILPYIVFIFSESIAKYLVYKELYALTGITIISDIILIVVLLINILFIRYIDKFAYIFNNITLLIMVILPIVQLIPMFNYDNTNAGIIDVNQVAIGVKLIELLIYTTLSILSFVYFHKRKHLFYTSVKELKKEYTFDDE